MNTRVLNALCKIASGAKEQRRAHRAARKAMKKAEKQAKKDFKRGVPIEQIVQNTGNRMNPALARLGKAYGLPASEEIPERPTEPTVVPNSEYQRISAGIEARQREIAAASKRIDQQRATPFRSIWSRLFGN